MIYRGEYKRCRLTNINAAAVVCILRDNKASMTRLSLFVPNAGGRPAANQRRERFYDDINRDGSTRSCTEMFA